MVDASAVADTHRAIGGLLFLLSIPVMMLACGYLDYKNNKKKEAKDDADNSSFLEAEKVKPRARIVIHPNSGAPMYVSGFEPKVDFWYPSWIRFTSRDLAIRHLEASYERGFFRNDEGITVPACNVMRAAVEEAK